MSGSRSRLAHQRRQAVLCEQRIPGRKDADFASKCSETADVVGQDRLRSQFPTLNRGPRQKAFPVA
jgi:hypothetical protein